mmetsp:Transcript_5834/g.12790  ORF Transcript_5834/g.12790 Transcript_5834/m.12790 type:complete len:253 (+) Transcript_5834:891-1649(+)
MLPRPRISPKGSRTWRFTAWNCTFAASSMPPSPSTFEGPGAPTTTAPLPTPASTAASTRPTPSPRGRPSSRKIGSSSPRAPWRGRACSRGAPSPTIPGSRTWSCPPARPSASTSPSRTSRICGIATPPSPRGTSTRATAYSTSASGGAGDSIPSRGTGTTSTSPPASSREPFCITCTRGCATRHPPARRRRSWRRRIPPASVPRPRRAGIRTCRPWRTRGCVPRRVRWRRRSTMGRGVTGDCSMFWPRRIWH